MAERTLRERVGVRSTRITSTNCSHRPMDRTSPCEGGNLGSNPGGNATDSETICQREHR